MSSGLYEKLLKENLIVSHEEADIRLALDNKAYKIIKPSKLDFISYPYEWSFSQLKDAALATLKIQKIALKHGMILKDSSAYNIQFSSGLPILIDTLSFEKYKENQPWSAYRQFCQHFLAPIALMSYKDIRLSQLLKIYIDGIPLDLASSLLPTKTKLSFSLLSHIHLHSKAQARYSKGKKDGKEVKVSLNGLIGIVDNLNSSIKKMSWKPRGTEWSDYYEETNYTEDSFQEKIRIVDNYLVGNKEIKTLWDLGANTGEFSRLASKKGINTIAFDIDPSAVEKNYLISKNDNDDNILPLICDLTNPSPDIGWNNTERKSLKNRGPVDCAMALALIHHLAISNNLPLSMIAGFFSEICNYLIIEFVPKDDSKVQFLLSSREDIFDNYDEASFEKEFSEFFDIKNKQKITGSQRTLYLMSKK